MPPSRVHISGRTERKEFHAPLRQCIEMFEQLGIHYVINPQNSSEPIEFALFLQSYPHEFSQKELYQLRYTHPFAPFFFLFGTCCEGILRTAGPLVVSFHGPFYRYVHAWTGSEPEEIRRFLTDQPSLFSLPMTVENDEIALWENPPKKPEFRQNFHEKCLILTRFGHLGNDSAMNRLLADEQRGIGFMPVFSLESLDFPFSGSILGDADDAPKEKILESIQRIRAQFADNDFTVYVDSPRINEKEDYSQAGATRILPKMRFH